MKRAVTAIALSLLLVLACTSASSPETGNVIKLAHNDWLSANCNDAVAQQLLKTLGYTVDLVPAGTTDQFPSIASGELHASLEVWPAGHEADITKDIGVDHTIDYAGLLGPIGKVGWFIPTYLLDEHPELATWDGFKVPANVALFSTPSTSPLGQFTGGDPSWVEYDAQIIQNLGLDFKVEYMGSEDAEIAALEAAYSKHEAIVMYFWLPHWALLVYDMTLVGLPPYSDACWATAAEGGIDCDYPTDHLFKMVWSGLKTYAPAAYRFLMAMSYSSQAQLDMMSMVQLQGMTVDQAAAAWIQANPAVWQPWIDAAKKAE